MSDKGELKEDEIVYYDGRKAKIEQAGYKLLLRFEDDNSSLGVKRNDPKLSRDLEKIVQKIKANKKIVLATAVYGKSDTNLLKKISTDPEKCYSMVKTGDALLDFLTSAIFQEVGND